MEALGELHKDPCCWKTRKNKRSHTGVSEDKKLELRLGLPGDSHDVHEGKKALLLQPGEKNPTNDNNNNNMNWLQDRPSYVLPYNNISSSHQNRKACLSVRCNASDDSTPPNCCNKRSARAPVVGWPPVRSSRKNIASNSNNSLKTPFPSFESDQKLALKEQAKVDSNGIESDNITVQDHLFLKINMEGVPIGRKVDLKAYDSYEKLSYAIDELFRGLLAAQRDYSASGSAEETIDAKTVSNGEYTLVYEDNEGDRMLVGDVPWKMFVSTAKRLRVLRTVELSTLKLTNSNQADKTPPLQS